MLTLDGYYYTLNITNTGVVSLFRDDEFVLTLHDRVEIQNISDEIKNVHDNFMEKKRVRLSKLQSLEIEANQLRSELGLDEQVITNHFDVGLEEKDNHIAPENKDGKKIDVSLTAYGFIAVWSWQEDWKAKVTLSDERITHYSNIIDVLEKWDETEWEGTPDIQGYLIHLARNEFLSWVWSDPMSAEKHLDFFTEEDIRLECSDKEREAQEAFFEAKDC